MLAAIRNADLIVLGPGSLYTSIVPNLLVPEIVAAIAASPAPRIYVCNIMSQPGETDGYSVSDHVRVLDRICGRRIFDAVLAQKKPPSESALRRYAQEQAAPIEIDRQTLLHMGCRVILANVMDEDPTTQYVRHSPQRLARVLMRWYSRTEGMERRSPAQKLPT